MALMLFVGARLLLVARRTLRAPEAGIGSSAFFGALGVLLLLVATRILGREPSAFPVWAAGVVGMGLGSSGLFIACWRIYRPAAPLAAAPAAVGAAIALSGCALRIFPGSIPPPIEPSIGQLLMQSASLGAYGWATVEAFHSHRTLRWRLRLGPNAALALNSALALTKTGAS